jgi:L-fuconolactonase
MIVDSHCHVSPLWYEPVESLLFQMERHGVGQAVLTQMLGQTDNAYQLSCVRRYPGVFAAVVYVDPAAPDLAERLGQAATDGATGVRVALSAGGPPATAPAIWEVAAALGLAISVAGTSQAFAAPAFAALVASEPRVPVVIEHLAGVSTFTGDHATEAARLQAFALARFPNVCLKLPGLGEFCPRAMPPTAPYPFADPAPAALTAAYAAFGSDRLLWGSDYPPISGREGYGNALHWPRTLLADKGSEALGRIFGGNAASIFRLSA